MDSELSRWNALSRWWWPDPGRAGQTRAGAFGSGRVVRREREASAGRQAVAGLSRKSAYVWHKARSLAGTEALLSKGPGGQGCRLSDGQMQRLEVALDAGPAAHGWSEDQRWTLARVALLVGRLCHVSYTPRGISYLLHRLGWSPQVPHRRAAERDEEAIATWVKETWPSVERPRGIRTGGSASPTNAP
jgi:transposase